jgi:DNA-binding response OmpR family regulator
MTASILLVDDELHVAQILGRRLEREGYRVRTARDGVEAVEAALADRPDLVISDYQMPRMDGMALARRLADEPTLRGLPVILLTARGHRVDQDLLATTGVVRLMAKPFSAHEVAAVVGEVLARGEAA